VTIPIQPSQNVAGKLEQLSSDQGLPGTQDRVIMDFQTMVKNIPKRGQHSQEHQAEKHASKRLENGQTHENLPGSRQHTLMADKVSIAR
jgi:hypothetical protein